MYTHCVYSSICIQFNLEIGSAVQMFSDNSSLLNIRCRTADVNTSSDGSDIKKEREGTFVFPAFSYFLQFLPFFPSGECAEGRNRIIRLSGWIIFTVFLNKLLDKFCIVFCYTHFIAVVYFSEHINSLMSLKSSCTQD